ncbi:MAG: hypothetical protein LQ352_001724 [Teloschistes flavicans]|nr:MAG: hypothetical protein LQ352_001724 [Teloschistes flavicans]
MGNLVSAPRSRPQIVHHGFHDRGGNSMRRVWEIVEKFGDEAEANAQLARDKLKRRRQRYEGSARQPNHRGDRARPNNGDRERMDARMTGALGEVDSQEEPPYGTYPSQDSRSNPRGLPSGRQDRTAFHTAQEQFDQGEVEEGGYGYGGVPGQPYQGPPPRARADNRGQQQFRHGPVASRPRRARRGHGLRRQNGSGTESGSGQ